MLVLVSSGWVSSVAMDGSFLGVPVELLPYNVVSGWYVSSS
jgi:hypothetical protein